MPKVSSKRVSKATWDKMSAAQKAAKRKAIAASSGIPRIRGKGAYTYDKPGPWGQFGRRIGGIAGGMLGSKYGAGKLGNAVGSKLGSYLHYIGKIFGSGDYVTASDGVKQNSLLNNVESQIPSFGSKSNEVRIRHREYLGDVISSGTAGAFNIQSFPLNPGVASTYPWLSQVCGATFQQYRINGQVYEFRSMSADALNSTNTALGSVVMATDYDSKDNVFNTKQQMENTMFGVSCKPSSCMIHAIECARSQTAVSELYIRASAVPSGADIRLYDQGRFSIATVGCQGTNVNLGELWVSYDITLIKQIEQPPGFLNLFTDFNLAGTDATKPLLLDTSVNKTQPAYDTIGVVSISNTACVLPLTLQTKSVYMLIWMLRGGSTANLVLPTFTYSGGLSSSIPAGIGLASPFINGLSSGFTCPQGAVAATTLANVQTFYYDGTGTNSNPPTITLGAAGTFPGAVVQGGNFIIMQLPSAQLL